MSYTLKIRQNVAGWILQLFRVSASRLASTAASINNGLNIFSYCYVICFSCSQLKSSTTLKNLSNWGLLKLAAVRSSSSLQTGLNSSLHKHPSCRDLSCCCYSSSDLPTTDSWTVLSCTVCSWIMNRLDQLTELRSKLQADWLFKFTETDQSKPVTMLWRHRFLTGRPAVPARLPVRGLQCIKVVASGATAAGVSGLMKDFLNLKASMVLVLAITQWDSLGSCSPLERRLPPPHIAGRGHTQWFEMAQIRQKQVHLTCFHEKFEASASSS